MRKLVLLFILVQFGYGQIVVKHKGGGSPVFAQAVGADIKHNGETITLSSPVTVGNTIKVGMYWSYVLDLPTLTDSLGNTYTRQGAPGGYYSPIWFNAPVTFGGSSDTITLHSTSGYAFVVFAAEYSSLNGAVDSTLTEISNTVSPCLAGPLTTSVNGDLIMGIIYNTVLSVYTPTTGWVLRAGPTTNGHILIDKIQTTAGAISPSATCTNPASAIGLGAGFKK